MKKLFIFALGVTSGAAIAFPVFSMSAFQLTVGRRMAEELVDTRASNRRFRAEVDALRSQRSD